MIAAMSQQKNVNKQDHRDGGKNTLHLYEQDKIKWRPISFDGIPVGLLDANFEEVRKSNSPGFKKKQWSIWKKHMNIQ